MTSRAPALAKPSAMARPRPREEPVTRAVLPERSKSDVDMLHSRVAATDGQVGALEHCRQQIDAEPRPLHRIDVAILDQRHRRDKLVVPALVEGAYRFLDQGIGLAE